MKRYFHVYVKKSNGQVAGPFRTTSPRKLVDWFASRGGWNWCNIWYDGQQIDSFTKHSPPPVNYPRPWITGSPW